MLSNGSLGWGSPTAPGATTLLNNMNLTIKRGQRILVLGPNGAGKSTFLKMLGGQLPLWSGTRKVGDGARVSYFAQDLAQVRHCGSTRRMITRLPALARLKLHAYLNCACT